MPPRSSSSSGVVFLEQSHVLAEVRRTVAVLPARVGVQEAWLFGSLAHGEAFAVTPIL